jgi:hypothetical protein
MRIHELEAELRGINRSIQKVLKDSGYERYGDIPFNALDADEAFRAEELNGILSDLESVRRRIDYLSTPVRTVARLSRDDKGRYFIITEKGELTFTSGSSIEFLTEENGSLKWALSTVEYSQSRKDYFITGYPELNLDGLQVRVRAFF